MVRMAATEESEEERRAMMKERECREPSVAPPEGIIPSFPLLFLSIHRQAVLQSALTMS
jgi:hypothetical protein